MDGDTSPAHTTGPVQRQNTKADLHFEHSSPFHKGVLNAIFTGPPKITMLSATLFSPFVNLLLAEARPNPINILVPNRKPSSWSVSKGESTNPRMLFNPTAINRVPLKGTTLPRPSCSLSYRANGAGSTRRERAGSDAGGFLWHSLGLQDQRAGHKAWRSS